MRVRLAGALALLLLVGCSAPPACVPVSVFALRALDVVAPEVARSGEVLVRVPVPSDGPPYWPGAVIAARDVRAGTTLVWLTGGVRHTGELIGPIVALDDATDRVSPGAHEPVAGGGLEAARERVRDGAEVRAARACVSAGT